MGQVSPTSPYIPLPPSTTVNTNFEEDILIWGQGNTEPGLPEQNVVVDPPSATVEWKRCYPSYARSDHTIRCLSAGMGSC